MPELLIPENCPQRLILTNDPQRVKMLCAHHPENAMPIREQGETLIYFGGYKGAEIALISVGFKHNAALPYLSRAKKHGVSEIIYIGPYIATAREYALRSVILVEGGDPGLLNHARSIASQYMISAVTQPILSGDGIIDPATETIYACAREYDLTALSILTVAENRETGECMEDHERRSRFYAASRLAFETFAQARL